MTSVRPIVREHPIPTADSKPHIVANGPDGAIWFGKVVAQVEAEGTGYRIKPAA